MNNKRFLETDQHFKISLLPEIGKAHSVTVYIHDIIYRWNQTLLAADSVIASGPESVPSASSLGYLQQIPNSISSIIFSPNNLTIQQ